MNLHEMQDFLNKLNIQFKVFVYPSKKSNVLRVFYKDSNKKNNQTDIWYNIEGTKVIVINYA